MCYPPRVLLSTNWLLGLAVFVLTLATLEIVQTASSSSSSSSSSSNCKLGSLCAQKAKEMELGIKVMLNKVKIRKEPLARANNEKLLKKSLQSRRKLVHEIEKLENSIAALEKPPSRRSNSAPSDENSERSGQRVKFTHLTKKEIQSKRDQLEVKRRQLAQLRVTIKEAKSIIAHPESYVRVPSNFGARSPEVVRDEEIDTLVKDLENMDRRDKIRRGLIPEPLVLSDNW